MLLLRLTLFFGLLCSVAACSSPAEPGPPPCDGGQITLAPTATRPTDPDLFAPPAPPAGGGDETVYCPTPVAEGTPAGEAPTGFVATEVANLSLDLAGQRLAAVAAGDDMLAVAWLADDDIYVALSRGSNHFQVRLVDRGQSVSLAFSKANRLHMAYEQDGQILYRAADQGAHPADAPVIPVADVAHPVTAGRDPIVVVDELSWAHVLYEQDGSIYKAKHLSNDTWLTQFVAYGTRPAARPFYNQKEVVLWGIPTGTAWFGILLAAVHEGQMRVFRYLSWFNVWEQLASFPIPAGEAVTGPAGLDYLVAGEDEAWVYATWVTQQPNPAPPPPAYAQPIYEAANPLYPDQLANPDQIYAGLNAVRWYSDRPAPFAAGLQQRVTVADPAGVLSLTAWGLARPAGGPAPALRVGIDPQGGLSPAGADVIWGDSASPDSYQPFNLTVPAGGGQATIFLQATLDSANPAGLAVWDGVTLANGDLVNGGFEGPFVSQSSLTVPEGWTAYYQDGGALPVERRDRYTVYAAWSADGGRSWSEPAAIVANQAPNGSTTGAIRPDVVPLLSLATEPPSASFFYLYEQGDPPAGSQFLRFGRPYTTQCTLGTTTCSDTPGRPLLLRQVVRPSQRLLLAADPLNPQRAILVWDALQTDNTRRDVYGTLLTLR